MTGTSGEQPNSPPSTSTPTGFNASYMSLVLGLISYLAINRSPNVATLTSDSKDNSDKAAGFDVLLVTAIQFAMDSIIDASDGPLAPTISNILKAFSGGSGIWFLIMELVSLPYCNIRNRALQMLRLAITTPTRKLDAKQVHAFERVNGFAFIADRLAAYPWDPLTLELLLDLLFWRVKKGSADMTNAESDSGRSARSPSVSEETEEEDRVASKAEILDESKLNEVDETGGFFTMFGWRKTRRTDFSSASIASPTSPKHPEGMSSERNSVHAEKIVRGLKEAETTMTSHFEKPLIEKISIPQILPSLFAMLQSSTNANQVVISLSPLESAISKRKSVHGVELQLSELLLVDENISAFSSNKDWLHWICKALFCIHQRLSREVENPTTRENALREQCDPFYNLVQALFLDDLTCKPSSARKIFQIFRIINSKYKFLQLGNKTWISFPGLFLISDFIRRARSY